MSQKWKDNQYAALGVTFIGVGIVFMVSMQGIPVGLPFIVIGIVFISIGVTASRSPNDDGEPSDGDRS